MQWIWKEKAVFAPFLHLCFVAIVSRFSPSPPRPSPSLLHRTCRPSNPLTLVPSLHLGQVDPELPLSSMKTAYRRLSILVHPDKNPDNTERAQKAFEAVSKAWKMVEDETELKKAKEVIEEGKIKTDAMVSLWSVRRYRCWWCHLAQAVGVRTGLECRNE